MVAITLWQPWATLVAVGAKRIETRGWGTRHRGYIAIHAAKNEPAWARALCAHPQFRTDLARVGVRSAQDLPRGAIVAVCRLIDCQEITSHEPPSCTVPGFVPAPSDLVYGDYSPGRWAWFFADIRRVEPPVRTSGAPGLWAVDDEILTQVLAQGGRQK